MAAALQMGSGSGDLAAVVILEKARRLPGLIQLQLSADGCQLFSRVVVSTGISVADNRFSTTPIRDCRTRLYLRRRFE